MEPFEKFLSSEVGVVSGGCMCYTLGMKKILMKTSGASAGHVMGWVRVAVPLLREKGVESSGPRGGAKRWWLSAGPTKTITLQTAMMWDSVLSEELYNNGMYSGILSVTYRNEKEESDIAVMLGGFLRFYGDVWIDEITYSDFIVKEHEESLRLATYVVPDRSVE